MVQLREFKLDDYDAVYTLWQNSGPGVGLGYSDRREEIGKKLERDPDLFFVAEEGGRIVGTVIGGYDGRRGMIYHLAVAETHRGQGTGTLLMTEVEQRLKAKGCQRTYLLVKQDAAEVIDFYRRLGWETWDVTIMGKTLGKR